MTDFRDIDQAIQGAENELARIKSQSIQIGRIAARPMILRNMGAYQLEQIKRQLKKFNMQTHQWRD